VGSEEAVSIAELAARVADVMALGRVDGDRPRVTIARQPAPGTAARYVPSCRRVYAELGLIPATGLSDAIARSATWHRRGQAKP